MNIDYLIIGQGLAGSLLGWELIQRGQTVMVIDNAKENASLIAAGLINPVTGLRFVKASNIEQTLPSALKYYAQLSDYFQQPFFIEKAMLRLLSNKKEQMAFEKRQHQSDYAAYFSELIADTAYLHSAYGIIKQKQTGYLLTRALLTHLKDYFIAKKAYLKAEINYSDINLSQAIQWKHIKSKKLIFCEGHHATSNPWFSYLPFQVVKGEIITATASSKMTENMLNYGHWFIPLNSQQFRIGATFDRNELNNETTANAKNQLMQSLHQVYPSLCIQQTNKQEAGIRPTTLDKQPFIGAHSHHPKLIIFNGFGAKGSLQIPWFCQSLADHLLNQQPLPEICNIQRYQHLL